MKGSPFRYIFPQVVRLEYEVKTEGTWEKRWVIVMAQSLSEAWTSFATRLSPEARKRYEQGEIRLVSASPALLLDVEYSTPPNFNMPVNGFPKTYYPMHGN